MSLRLAAILLAALCADASAQITLQASDTFLYPEGPQTVTRTAYDGAALSTLLAQSGADQTWDLTGLTAGASSEASVTVRDGADGPSASVEPLDDATRTIRTAFAPSMVAGSTFESVLYSYLELRSDGVYTLGAVDSLYINGAVSQAGTTRFLPAGARNAQASYTFGDSWSDTYTATRDGAASIESAITYEVDGWGRLVLPGGDSVPALRLKMTDQSTIAGQILTSVDYEFRTADGLQFDIDPNDGDPTGELIETTSGTRPTAPDGGPEVDGVTLSEAWPNPARTAASIRITVATPTGAALTVSDALGRTVRQTSGLALPAGASVLDVPTAGLPAGVYLVRVEVGDRVLARPLTVVR